MSYDPPQAALGNEASATPTRQSPAAFWAAGLGLVVGLAIVLPIEYRRLRAAMGSEAGWLAWLTEFEPDTTLPLILFLLLPLAWMIRRKRTPKRGRIRESLLVWFGKETKPQDSTPLREGLRAFLLACSVGVVSLLLSAYVGHTPVAVVTPHSQRIVPLHQLPPALHDEYSYLFQARTFLEGRVGFPSPARFPGLFDQMHVLNDNGVYAGRYFPGTALWMVPFVAVGQPHWGHWIAGALSAVFVFYAGRKLAGNGVGFLAGLLTAVSPGILLFGQLLLAHHPTLLGLTFFAWMFLRMMRTRSYLSAALAGMGLAFAMLCRPMTAAGIGLPFGLWFLYWWFHPAAEQKPSNQPPWDFKRRTLLAASLGFPLLVGIGGMLIYNNQLTGNPFLTPYQLYTNIYTPRHIYGFNNVERAESSTSGKVLENYDRWAENLTPALAWQNVQSRLIASGQWILGLVPLAVAIGVFVVGASWSSAGTALADSRWWLIFTSAISLHLVHIPYWFSGIRNWHYVFEAAPFVLLVFAGGTAYVLQQFGRRGFIGIVFWWLGLLGMALWVAYGPLPGDAPASRVHLSLGEDIWARRNYAVFDDMLEHTLEKPALVLIAENPADRHIDYVTNIPTLDTPIIRGRFRPESAPLEDVLTSYRDRTTYVVVLNSEVEAKIENGIYDRVRFEEVARQPTVSGTAIVYRLHPRK